MPASTRLRRVTVLCIAVAGGLTGWAAPARADSVGSLTPLVDAAAQRLQIADPVAAYKWHTRGAIEDPVRVRQELAKLGDDAVVARIDRDYVTRVFGDQIDATEAIEYSRFADWKLNPGDAPADPADLAASRSAIDGLNQEMLTQISRNWDVLHSPACAPQLGAARSDIAASRRLDDLYQRALWSATQSYCQQ
ncbi:chorismate mutase [Mycobacterium marseillense]|jgi:chorismate mutase|uniref:Chorismate mutase n=1 Tax=Mycobacterium marseillense TaxID=701042 RepID=A0AAC9VR08_9MYCO|nr:chorismate mutase [Mycobacterium marseillense]ASW90511.1 chorismate mutase AroQ, gamma subclass [Mycobacterium marseillense]MCV7403184.1 chorismate mutase [Mycobacterium marseillense]MDM3972884.1 chorismate mutase [Mycobacterium marseillense]ORA87371.1 chorismate mutase [Mycobacterium marseillense]BBY10114.1 secreted chorismate mutase [Mycobacterium marseillense]